MRRSRPEHLSVLFLALSLLVTACSLESEEPAAPIGSADDNEAAPAPAEGGTGAFHVTGKDIVGPDGNIFVPVGANVGAPVVDSEGQDVWVFRLQAHDITKIGRAHV